MILQGDTYPHKLELHPHGRRVLSCNLVETQGDQSTSCLELECEDMASNGNPNCFSLGDIVISSAIRSVRFNTSPSIIHEYLHVDDITIDEKSLTWWSPTRTRRIGLVSSQQRRKRIRSTRWIVLTEQERQRKIGMNNPFLISCKYALACHEAVLESQERGTEDYQELVRMNNQSIAEIDDLYVI